VVKRLLLTLLVLLASAAQAELTIQVTQGKQSALPIAIVPFEWGGPQPLPEDIRGIVNDDLGRSGYFRTLATENMIGQPYRPEQVIYADWKNLRQDFLVTGTIGFDGTGYSVDFHVMDVHQKIELFHHRVRGSASQLRDMAHYISDFVFSKLTGIPGVFSTKIVYVTTNRERNRFNLNYADADGAREQLIFTSTQPIISPAWAPDGKRIAYVSFESGRTAIYFQELATGKRQLVLNMKGSNSAPAFSPDGTKLAFVHSEMGNPDIHLLDLASGRVSRLTDHYAIDTEPQFLADNRTIVFTSSRSGGPQIYSLDSQTLEVKRITFQGNYNARARVTDDGRKLIYVHREGERFHIASQDLASGAVNILTVDTQLDESPSVAPNGSMVIYAATEANRSILAAVSVDGDVKFRLPSKYGDVREPAWSPIF
jgi:TolB protein